MTLKYSIAKDGDWQVVALTGKVREDAESVFSPLLVNLKGHFVRFDLAGIDQMNSIGVSLWQRFVSDLGTRGAVTEFIRCNEVIVNYLALVPGVLGDGKVRSIFVPLHCHHCGAHHDDLLQLDTLDSREKLTTLRFPCKGCGQAAEPAVPLDDYCSWAFEGAR